MVLLLLLLVLPLLLPIPCLPATLARSSAATPTPPPAPAPPPPLTAACPPRPSPGPLRPTGGTPLLWRAPPGTGPTSRTTSASSSPASPSWWVGLAAGVGGCGGVGLALGGGAGLGLGRMGCREVVVWGVGKLWCGQRVCDASQGAQPLWGRCRVASAPRCTPGCTPERPPERPPGVQAAGLGCSWGWHGCQGGPRVRRLVGKLGGRLGSWIGAAALGDCSSRSCGGWEGWGGGWGWGSEQRGM